MQIDAKIYLIFLSQKSDGEKEIQPSQCSSENRKCICLSSWTRGSLTCIKNLYSHLLLLTFTLIHTKSTRGISKEKELDFKILVLAPYAYQHAFTHISNNTLLYNDSCWQNVVALLYEKFRVQDLRSEWHQSLGGDKLVDGRFSFR